MKLLVRQQNRQENHKFHRKRVRIKFVLFTEVCSLDGQKKNGGLGVVNYDRKLNRKLLCELKTFLPKKYRNLSAGSAGKKLLVMHVSIK